MLMSALHPLHAKFRLKPGLRLAVQDAPKGFRVLLEPLPEGAKWVTPKAGFDQLHGFVRMQTDLRAIFDAWDPHTKEGQILWIYFPKGSSGIQTDLTRDRGWEPFHQEGASWQQLTLISLNDTWSAFGFRKTGSGAAAKKSGVVANKADAAQKPVRPSTTWIDPIARRVTAPPELIKAFKTHPQARARFEKMSYTHQREYVEWIVDAVKEETRQKRLEKMMELLERK